MALSDFYVKCTKMEKESVASPSGTVNIWADGKKFEASIGVSASREAFIASQNTGKEIYSILTDKTTELSHGDYFRNEETGRFIRVTSPGTDAPRISTLSVKRYFGEYVDKLPD